MALKLGAQIDVLYKLDREIKAAESALNVLKRERAELETALLEDFDKQDIDGCKGRLGVASVRRARFPTIKDWKKFEKYVFTHRALDLMHRRVASKAYFDRLEEGDRVPGIEVFERVGVSITKRGR